MDLPEELRFKERYLEAYKPGMAMPRFSVGRTGLEFSLISEEPEHPLSGFLGYCSLLMRTENQYSINARQECGVLQLRAQGDKVPEVLRLSEEHTQNVSGSIALYASLKEEMKKVVEYAKSKGFPERNFPIAVLVNSIKSIEAELAQIEEQKSQPSTLVIRM